MSAKSCANCEQLQSIQTLDKQRGLLAFTPENWLGKSASLLQQKTTLSSAYWENLHDIDHAFITLVLMPPPV